MRRGLQLFVRRSLVLISTVLVVLFCYCVCLQMIISVTQLRGSGRRQTWENDQLSPLKLIGLKQRSSQKVGASRTGFQPAYPLVDPDQIVDGYPTINFGDLQQESDSIVVQDPMFSGKRKAFVKDGSRLVKIKRRDGKEQTFEIPICSDAPSGLQGRFTDLSMVTAERWMSEDELSEKMIDIGPGGNWRPEHCIARNRLAVIVPYRNRSDHLPRLLSSLIPILKRQLIDFRFIVVEQFGNDLFNKGRLFNAAFTVAEQLQVDCVIFHDVDLFPNDDRNPYGCPHNPRHMGAFIDTLGYELLYSYLAGGVLAIRTDQFKLINGYSNVYWGWGGEDDDIGKRIVRSALVMERPDTVQGRMTMLKHGQRSAKAPHLMYAIMAIGITRRPLYYHVYVDVGTPPEIWFKIDTTGPPDMPKWLAKRRRKSWQRKPTVTKND